MTANLPPGVQPVYQDIRDLPEERIAPFLRDAFSKAASERYPELDQFLTVGKKARQVRPNLVDGVLQEWLSGAPDPKRAAIAANFLAAYWTHESTPPGRLLELVLEQLRMFADRSEISELLLLAIDAIYPPASPDLKAAIQGLFRYVAEQLKDRALQPFAATALNRVLTS
jgi:hypothetical protein